MTLRAEVENLKQRARALALQPRNHHSGAVAIVEANHHVSVRSKMKPVMKHSPNDAMTESEIETLPALREQTFAHASKIADMLLDFDQSNVMQEAILAAVPIELALRRAAVAPRLAEQSRVKRAEDRENLEARLRQVDELHDLQQFALIEAALARLSPRVRRHALATWPEAAAVAESERRSAAAGNSAESQAAHQS